MLRVGEALRARGHVVMCWGADGHGWLVDAERRGLIGLTRPLPSTFDLHTQPELVGHIRQLRPDAALLNLDRDGRGLALALQDDENSIPLAIADFRAFARASERTVNRMRRLSWVARLENGEQPSAVFDAEEIRVLQQERIRPRLDQLDAVLALMPEVP